MKESEGNAMKKGKEWLKEAVGELNLVDTVFEADGVSYIDTAVSVMQVYDLIDQLDEPEVLSQEWIDKNKFEVNGWNEAVHVEDLQNLLVPKQEELESKIKVLIEAYKQEEDAYSNPENGWISGFIEDLKNLVEKEPKYYIIDKNDEVLWYRDNKGIPKLSGSTLRSVLKSNSKDRYQFTEQEIKKYDVRFWPFAEPVEQADFRLSF